MYKNKKMGLGRGDLYIDSENLERRLLYLSFANLNRFFSNKNENFLYVVGFRGDLMVFTKSLGRGRGIHELGGIE